MRDLLGWSFSLGRWAGVHVRLHVFFMLLAVIALYLALKSNDPEMLWYAAAGLVILLVSVLAHEIGHCVAARRMGGHADQIVVWPLGGLAHVNLSHQPQEELVTSVVGPLVNMAICMLAAPAILLSTADPLDVVKLLNPLSPPESPVPPHRFGFETAVQLVFWINWGLALVNLLPAYPLDGGRILRAILWSRKGYRTSVQIVARVAQVTAVAAFVAAVLVHSHYPFAVVPLALLGFFLFFSAKQEVERLHDRESDDGLFGYDFSQGYTSLEKSLGGAPAPRSPGPVRQWLENRREARLRRQKLAEEDEERRVDEILARLHEQGADSLTHEDRSLLERVSARYRNRQGGV